MPLMRPGFVLPDDRAPAPIPNPNLPVLATPPVAPGGAAMGGEGPGGMGNPAYLATRFGIVVPERGSVRRPEPPPVLVVNPMAPGGAIRGGEGPMGPRSPYTGTYLGDTIETPPRTGTAPLAAPAPNPNMVDGRGAAAAVVPPPPPPDPNRPQAPAASDDLARSGATQGEYQYRYRTAPDGTVYLYVPQVGEIVVPAPYAAQIIPEGQASGTVTLSPDQAYQLVELNLTAERVEGGDPVRVQRLTRAADAYDRRAGPGDDLVGAAGSAVGAIAGAFSGDGRPISEVVGETVTTAGQAAMDFYAWPQEQLYGYLGEQMYRMATAEDPGAVDNVWELAAQGFTHALTISGDDYSPTAFYAWSVNPENRAKIEDWYANGYDADGDGVADYTGGRAVWEGFQGERNLAQRAITDAALDPWNVLGLLGGVGTKSVQAGRALRAVDASGETVPLWRQILGLGAEAVGRAAQGVALPETVFDEAVSLLARGAGRAVGFTSPYDDAATQIWLPGGRRIDLAPLTPLGRTQRDLQRFADMGIAAHTRGAVSGDVAPGGPVMPGGGGIETPPPDPGNLIVSPPSPNGRGAPVTVRGEADVVDDAARAAARRAAAPANQPPPSPPPATAAPTLEEWLARLRGGTITPRPEPEVVTPEARAAGQAAVTPEPVTPRPEPDVVTPEARPTADEAAASIVAEGRPATASEVQRRSGAGYNEAAEAARRANAPEPPPPTPEPVPEPTRPPQPTIPRQEFGREAPSWVVLRDRGGYDPEATISRFRAAAGPEAEAEVWRRLGRTRYERHRAQMEDPTIPQPDKDLLAGRFELERRAVMREIAPDFDPGAPSLTLVRPRSGVAPPGDPRTARLSEVASWKGPNGRPLYTDRDVAQMAVQRTIYRPAGSPEAREARNLLYRRGIYAKQPPSEATYRAIVDGTYRPRQGRVVPHTNVVAEDLPNMPQAARTRLANEWRDAEFAAYRRYQDAQEINAAIFGEGARPRRSPSRPAPPPTPTPTPEPAVPERYDLRANFGGVNRRMSDLGYRWTRFGPDRYEIVGPDGRTFSEADPAFALTQAQRDAFDRAAREGEPLSEEAWERLVDPLRREVEAEERTLLGAPVVEEGPPSKVTHMIRPVGPTRPTLVVVGEEPPPNVVPLASRLGAEPTPTPSAPSATPAPPPPPAGEAVGEAAGAYQNVRLDQITLDPARFQPRDLSGNPTGVDPERVQTMAENWSWGDYQPIKVWREPGTGRLILLSGHHRFEAAKLAGIDALPTQIVEGVDEVAAQAIADASNSVRPLTPVEYGEVIQRDLNRGLNIREAAKRHGIKQSQAERYLKLNALPADVKQSVARGLLSPEQGAALSDAITKGAFSPAEVQAFVVGPMVERQYTAADIDNIVRGILDRRGKEAARQAQGTMFDLGQFDQAAVFDQLADLGRQLAEQTRLRNALRTVAKSDLPEASAAAKAALDAVTARVNDLRQQLGYQPIRGANPGGGVIVQDAIFAIGRLLNPRRPVRGRLRKNTGLATDFSAGEFTDAQGRRRLLTGQEVATFNDPALRFGDGTRWWDRYRELVDQTVQAGGVDEREAAILAMAELAEQIARDRGLSVRERARLWRLMDAYLAGIRDIIMYNPTRVLDQPLTQGIGNFATLLIAGKPRAAGRMLLRPRAYADAIAAKHELGDTPRALRGIDPTLDPEAGIGSDQLPIRRFAEDKLTRMLGTSAGRISGKGTSLVAWDKVRDLTRATDELARHAVWGTEYRKLVPQAWGDFRQEALSAARRRGLDQDAMRDVLDRMSGEWGPTAVYAEVKNAFGDAGLAEHLSRSWASATGRMRDQAVREVHRVLFSGFERGGGEKGLRRLFLFHYFASRQTALYATQALRHPGLMNAYLNAVEGFDRYAEEHDLPGTVKGFVRLFGTVYGFQMYLNPVLLLSTYLTFRDAGGGMDDKGWIDFLKESVFINPLIEAAVEYLGAYDDGFLSDPTGLRPGARLATALYNLGVASGLIPGDIAFSDPIARVEQEVRSWLSGRLPGTEHKPAEDPGAVNQDKFFNLIVANAMDQGMTFEEAVDAATAAMLAGPGDPLYDAAADEYAKAGLVIEGARLLGPWSVQGRVPVRDQTMVGREVVRGDRAPDPDVTYPGTTTPVAPGDTPENEALGAARGAASATEEGARLNQMDDEYDAIGTPAGREAVETWNAIAFGEPEEPVTIRGTTYTADMLSRLPDAMRRGLADAWAMERGLDDDIERQRAAQDAYRQAHPEYDAYLEWRSDLYDHEGGVIGWWESQPEGSAAAVYYAEAREGNPTQRQLIGRLTSPDAYLATQGIEASAYQAELPEPAPAGTATTTTERKEAKDPASQIRADVQAYRAGVAAAAEVLALYGIDPYVFEYGTPEQQDLAEAVLARHGLAPPRLSGDARGYLEWANAQMAGSDTSVEAYLRHRAGLDAEAAARTAPYYFGQPGDLLSGFFDGGLGPWSLVLGLPGDSYNYGQYGFPSTGTRLPRPQFDAGPNLGRLGGLLGTRMPR